MPFKITSSNARVLSRVVNGQSCPFYLPAGTYIFRRIPHPYVEGWGDWLVLEQPQLLDAGLDPEDIIGMDYECFMFASKPSVGGFAGFYMTVEEIIPITVLAEQSIEVFNDKATHPTHCMTPIPVRPYPSFVRHYPPRGSNTSRSLWNRVMYFHPAARRVCCA